MNAKRLATLLTGPLLGVDLDACARAAAENKRLELQELQAEQMQAGQAADGAPITPPYTRATVKIKKAKGQPADRVTLRDSGDFQRKIRARPQRRGVVMDSTDSKTAGLVEKYGEEIFGFNAQNTAEAAEELKPGIRLEFKKRLRRK